MSRFVMPPPGAPVQLREITAANVRHITDVLEVDPAQAGYVASNAVSLAEALFHPEAWFRAIHAGDVPVGFVMVSDETLLTPAQRAAAHAEAGEAMPAEPRFFLWRFMIDRRCQRRGFGRAALEQVLAHARTRPGIAAVYLSYVPGPHGPQGFYEAQGFRATGEVEDGEVVMRLDLPAPQAAPAAAAEAATQVQAGRGTDPHSRDGEP